MSFLNLEFLAGFTVFFYLYWFSAWNEFSKRLLIICASALFYFYFSGAFLFHFLFITSLNFLIARYFLSKPYGLKLGVGLNLANLFLFKYFYLFLALIGGIFGISELTLKPSANLLIARLLGLSDFDIILPATISYYTFQFISMQVDLSRKNAGTDLKFFDVLSYVFLFPVMIAGPILRFENALNGFHSASIDRKKMIDGLFLICKGVLKKSFLSDGLASIIYPVFSDPVQYSGSAILFTTYFFGLHLFLDFSGLTDMARGLGKLLGLELPENFKAPFFMNSFGDFWRRWHLTFSFWIRDYIYIPLGGSKAGRFRTYFNLVITFALGGLWHGANFNYAFWGIINGLFLVGERVFEENGWKLIPSVFPGPILKYLIVIHISMISWILFFTPNIQSAWSAVYRVLSFQPGRDLMYAETGIYAGLFTLLFHFEQEFPERFEFLQKWKPAVLPFLALFILLGLVYMSGRNMDFFYGKF
ncbi:MAG TPA: MBOAT family O-acyltransferase [Leptospiraceae bacterium]|nr:MBOAT family O-acyltransferase [Leptospiraceae bacterium]